jgi:hypothetical protein
MLNGKGNGEVVGLGFSAGFIGAAAVLLIATIVFYCGIGPALIRDFLSIKSTPLVGGYRQGVKSAVHKA